MIQPEANEAGNESDAETSRAQPAAGHPQETDPSAAESSAAVEAEAEAEVEDPGDQALAGKAGDEISMAADAPGDEAAAGDAPGDEAAAGDAPGDEAAGGEEELPPLVPVLEAALFASAEPVPLTRLTRVLGAWNRKQVLAAIAELVERQEREGSGVRVVETAGGFQLRSVVDYAPWVRKFFTEKPPRLSRPVLETLALVAYRQPATRGEVEAVRGVNCDAVLGALTARGLVQVVGRRQSPGRPVEYGTTQEFLELFSMRSLEDLPPLPDPASLAALIESAEEAADESSSAEATEDGEFPAAAAEGLDETTGAMDPLIDAGAVDPEAETVPAGEREASQDADDGETTEDPESGGHRLEAGSGAIDSRGEGPGQR